MLWSRAGLMGFISLWLVKAEPQGTSMPWLPTALGCGCQQGRGKRGEEAQTRPQVPGLGGHADVPRSSFPVPRMVGKSPTSSRSLLLLPAPHCADPIAHSWAANHTAGLI